MSKQLIIGERLKVVEDDTGEFLGCVGFLSRIDHDSDSPYGVSFGKADNTIPLGNGTWGAWFERRELRRTRQPLSPICPVPPKNRLSKPMIFSQ